MTALPDPNIVAQINAEHVAQVEPLIVHEDLPARAERCALGYLRIAGITRAQVAIGTAPTTTTSLLA
jgi:hypothetical protein